MGKFFYLSIAGLVAGVVLSESISGVELVYATLAVTVAFALVLLGAVEKRLRPVSFLVAGVFLVFTAGFCRAVLISQKLHNPAMDAALHRTVELEGVVDALPDIRENHQRLYIAVGKIFLEDGKREIETDTRVLVVTDRYKEINFAERVRVTGVIDRPKTFSSKPGFEFDYPGFLSKEGVGYESAFPDIVVLGESGQMPIRKLLYGFKKKLTNVSTLIIPSPSSALLSGLLFGEKQPLGKNNFEMFRLAGLVHIIVLSGYNISIISRGVFRFLFFVPLPSALVISVVIVASFIVMTGASATAVRAGIMAMIAMMAKFSNREFDANRALFSAAALMIFFNPAILLHDSSFHLSLIATFAVINFSPIVSGWLGRMKMPDGVLREITAVTVATQTFVLPLLFYFSGEVSPVALAANLYALPVVPIAMFLGSLTVVIGLASAIVAAPLAFFSYAALSWIIFVAHIFSKFPMVSIGSRPPIFLIVFFYLAVILAVIFRIEVKRSRQKRDALKVLAAS